MGDGGGQRHDEAEGGAFAFGEGGFDAAAQRLDFGADHVHAHATARQLRDLRHGGKAGREDEAGDFLIAELLAGLDEAALDGAGADARGIQPAAVVVEGHGHVVAGLAHVNGDGAGGFLAPAGAHGGLLDAVHHAVAQEVLEGGRHAIQNASVHFNGAAGDFELDGLAGFLGGLAHHAVQALGDAFELHHARAQQIALEFARLARLRHKIVFAGVERALQGALHGGHVVHGLGHHAGEFLHAGETVELQRVEVLLGVLGERQARLHLGFGLQLHVAQLLAQAVEVAGEVAQRVAQQAQRRLRQGGFAGA